MGRAPAYPLEVAIAGDSETAQLLRDSEIADAKARIVISYAQNFEDVRLWRALGADGPGFYVDIGAQDPVVDSVSRAFYENGWRGLHVEPSPDYAARIAADRPDEPVIQAVVSSVPGLVSFFEFPGTGLSTSSLDVAQGHVKAGRAMREIVVPSITLEALFAKAGAEEIRWLKIDVEGAEREVLESWGESPARPWVVVVEGTEPLSQRATHEAWEALILTRGYSFACFDGLNRFYVASGREALAHILSPPPNVFDAFSLSGLATSSFSDRLNERIAEERARAEKCEVLLAEAREEAAQLAEQSQARIAAAREEIERLAGHLVACGQGAVESELARLTRVVELADSNNRDLARRWEVHVAEGRAALFAAERRLGGRVRELRGEFSRLVTQAREREAAGESRWQEGREQAHREWLRQQARIESLESNRELLVNLIRTVFASASWRVTAPLRSLNRLLAQLAGRPVSAAADQVSLNAPAAPLPASVPLPIRESPLARALEPALKRRGVRLAADLAPVTGPDEP